MTLPFVSMDTTELLSGAKATISPTRGTEKMNLPLSASCTLTEPSTPPTTNHRPFAEKPPNDAASAIRKRSRPVLRFHTFTRSDLSPLKVATDSPSGEYINAPTTWAGPGSLKEQVPRVSVQRCLHSKPRRSGSRP